MAKEILSDECGLEVQRTRFMVGRLSWPLHFVCFEGDSRWAYFEPNFYQIGLNKRLAGRVKDSVLRDLLRHELAHYLARVFYGEKILPHGPEFKAICERYHWPLEVAEASGDLLEQHEAATGDLASDALVEKVKKLMALASSDNPHEAELATLKANQLILRHHLDRAHLTHEADTELCVLVVLREKRKSGRMVAIYDILTHFMVKPLLSYGKSEVRLEVIGERSQVQLADYVASYLARELEVLWRASRLKGLRAKNSFYTGIARGYREKLDGVRRSCTLEEKSALVRVERLREELIREFMRGLGSSRSGQILDGAALAEGTRAGKSLNIHPALKKSTAQVLALGHSANRR